MHTYTQMCTHTYVHTHTLAHTHPSKKERTIMRVKTIPPNPNFLEVYPLNPLSWHGILLSSPPLAAMPCVGTDLRNRSEAPRRGLPQGSLLCPVHYKAPPPGSSCHVHIVSRVLGSVTGTREDAHSRKSRGTFGSVKMLGGQIQTSG